MNFYRGLSQARKTSFSKSLFSYNCTMRKYTKYHCAFHLSKKTVIRDFFPKTLLLKRQSTLGLIKHFEVSNSESLERGDVQRCLGAACVQQWGPCTVYMTRVFVTRLEAKKRGTYFIYTTSQRYIWASQFSFMIIFPKIRIRKPC